MDVRSTEELVAHGVSLFSAGDLAGAARVWLRALEQAPGERRAVGYLKHLKKVAPEILSLAEREVSVDLATHIQLSMPPLRWNQASGNWFYAQIRLNLLRYLRSNLPSWMMPLNHKSSQWNQRCPKVRRPLMSVVVTFPTKSHHSLLAT